MNNSKSFTSKIEEIFGDFGWEGTLTEDDLFYAQQAFLSQQNSKIVVEHLAEKYSIAPQIITSTILLIHDDPSICDLEVFPYSLLSVHKYPELVASLSKASQAFAINMLYRVYRKDRGFSASLDALAHILGANNTLLYLPEVWGLKRTRVGVIEPDDDLVTSLVYNCDINILNIGELKNFFPKYVLNQIKYKIDMTSAPDSLEGAPHGFEHMLANLPSPFESSRPFFLPFFLSPFLELFPTEDSVSSVSAAPETTQRLLSALMVKYLADAKIKENFMAMIANVCLQDRSKLVFDPKINCTDGFACNLSLLLLFVSEGMFNDRFVSKVGFNKFPTFSFFYIGRLLDISAGHAFREVQETGKRPRVDVMKLIATPCTRKYFNFVLDVINLNFTRIFKCLVINKDSKELSKGIDKNSNEGINKDSIMSFEDISNILENNISLIDFLPEYKLAIEIEDIPYDTLWINSILTLQIVLKAFYHNRLSHNLLSFISILFIYKNNHKNLALRILEDGNTLGDVLVKRLVRYYTDTNEDYIYQERFHINKILERESITADYNSLRMANALVSDMETRISGALKAIVNIKTYASKGKELKRKLGIASIGEEGRETELSEDEEAGSVPNESLRRLSFMNDEELKDYLKSVLRKSQRREEELNEMLKELKLSLLYFKDPYLYKLNCKIKVNKRRGENEERYLKTAMVSLQNIFHTLLSFSTRNRQLFLNKSIFSRICIIINGSIRDLVGRKSGMFRIENQEKYNYDPKELLRCLVQIMINILGDNRHLIRISSLDHELLARAYEICDSKYLISELYLGNFKRILEVLEKEETNEVEREVPDHFIDPLTCVVMKNPVRLITSNVIIDASTFRQIMLNDQIDPFNRMPLNESMYVLVPELEEEIRKFEEESK